MEALSRKQLKSKFAKKTAYKNLVSLLKEVDGGCTYGRGLEARGHHHLTIKAAVKNGYLKEDIRFSYSEETVDTYYRINDQSKSFLAMLKPIE